VAAADNNHSRGTVLVLVLVMIAILSVLAAGELFLARSEISASAAAEDGLQGRATAMSGIYRAIAVLTSQADAEAEGQEPIDYVDNPEFFQAQPLTEDEDSWEFTVYAPNFEDPDNCRYGLVEEAGKININTAIPETLDALRLGIVGAPDLKTLTTYRPFKSPAQILKYLNPSASNGIEQRDAAFTLISNIATVRSDTFSVYGTVQIVDPSRAQAANKLLDKPEDILRTRRFWALVDRSPSLAYPPTSTNFIYPRILNFQWLD